jgi:uncharacterized SAM-binding protein YcdF (DUF218 family)
MEKKRGIGRSLLRALFFALILLAASWLLNTTLAFYRDRTAPIDAFLVLGGSINREIYVATLAKQQPDLPILISQGSESPCVLLIFQKMQAPLDKVWLERCAQSTFNNLFFSVPILKSWQVKKVKLITSASHLPRAKLLGAILLNARGIAMDLELAPEKGIPGNVESSLKTTIDVTRSLVWALFSQAIHPSCSEIVRLVDVDLAQWQQKGFACERQRQLKLIN